MQSGRLLAAPGTVQLTRRFKQGALPHGEIAEGIEIRIQARAVGDAGPGKPGIAGVCGDAAIAVQRNGGRDAFFEQIQACFQQPDFGRVLFGFSDCTVSRTNARSMLPVVDWTPRRLKLAAATR